jgi:hypothetical protein
MSTATKLLCFVLALASLPFWIFITFFSGAYVADGNLAPGFLAILATMLVMAVWTAYFGWRTIKTWRTAGPASAILMALPAVVILLYAVWFYVSAKWVR